MADDPQKTFFVNGYGTVPNLVVWHQNIRVHAGDHKVLDSRRSWPLSWEVFNAMQTVPPLWVTMPKLVNDTRVHLGVGEKNFTPWKPAPFSQNMA